MKKIHTLSTATALTVGTLSSDAAQLEKVTFQSKGTTLVGHLYTPDNYQEGDTLPAVVVTGSWTSIKEQMAGGYAQALANKGYITLAFDARGWGESKDAIMYWENPTRKTEDVIAAAHFLTTLPQVDANKIAGLGICAGAGYITDAALASDVIKTAAVVAPWYHNAEIVDAVYGTENVQALIQSSREAEKTFKTTGKPVTAPAAGTAEENAIMQGATYYTDKDRGLIPEYDNLFNLMSWESWLTYDSIKTAEALKKPTLLVHSESAAIPQGAKLFAKTMGNHATAIWLDGVTQFDFYDNPQYVGQAVELVAKHFNKNL